MSVANGKWQKKLLDLKFKSLKIHKLEQKRNFQSLYLFKNDDIFLSQKMVFMFTINSWNETSAKYYCPNPRYIDYIILM